MWYQKHCKEGCTNFATRLLQFVGVMKSRMNYLSWSGIEQRLWLLGVPNTVVWHYRVKVNMTGLYNRVASHENVVRGRKEQRQWVRKDVSSLNNEYDIRTKWTRQWARKEGENISPMDNNQFFILTNEASLGFHRTRSTYSFFEPLLWTLQICSSWFKFPQSKVS
jgi:hypothetical protein